ncbi:MAG: dienelactone hydrolase family protein [Phaeodactylibacter sp.]|nr:dienelactone hydrolase family protein [Phaeodactylibacter sp.]MCB9294631.1 dienelactone hydrolase family protein [Lewinellaceae bacterium]
MLRHLILFAMALGLVFTSCQNSGKSGGQGEGEAADSSDMAQFAGDEKFKGAHEAPMELNFDGTGQMIEFDTPDGQKGSAYALMPEETSNKYLFVIHEWWGLNNHIKAEAERLFAHLGDVNVMALDIYDGKVADNPDKAGELMQSVKEERARAIIQGAINKAGADARIGTIGWCFGGGWSLKSAIMAGDQGVACVMYYGMPVQNAKEIAPLKAPILGIFAKQDEWITPEVAQKFENLAKAAGKQIEVQIYDANHAFANPSGDRYNEEAAQKANQEAWSFLEKHL